MKQIDLKGKTIFLKNIQLIDPFTGSNTRADLLAENLIIKQIGNNLKKPVHTDFFINGESCFIFPGLTDLHTHLREPGFEYKEDIASGTKAAVHGGYTRITSFPNTKPVLDNPETLRYIVEQIQSKAMIDVMPIASITRGLLGEELSDFETLLENGAVTFTDDGKGVQSDELMLKAMQLAKELNIRLLLHEENELLLNHGVIHLGSKSKLFNLPGISSECEEIMLARDILLAKTTGAKIHFCHVSTTFGAKLIEAAKNEGVFVSGEVTPHHLCFSEEDIKDAADANYKMNPPLRTLKDTDTLLSCLDKGIIDAIATDHAPHSAEEKKQGFLKAPFGITGLETSLPLIYTKLISKNKISFYRVIESLTKSPCDILNLAYSPIMEGQPLNFVIFNKDKKSVLHDRFFYSKSLNCPLIGSVLQGKIEQVFYRDKLFDFTEQK